MSWRSRNNKYGNNLSSKIGNDFEYSGSKNFNDHPDLTRIDIKNSITDPNENIYVKTYNLNNPINLIALCDISSSMSVDKKNNTIIKDLSKNTKLEYVWFANNKLIDINLKNLEFLEELQLIGNQLETIDLSDNPYLKILRLGENNFSSFDLKSTPRVYYLVLKDNPLTEIKNLIDLGLLKDLYVDGTNLSSLDVSSLTSLDYLDASDSSILDCIQVSQSQLDNLVSSWLFDEGTQPSLDCN